MSVYMCLPFTSMRAHQKKQELHVCMKLWTFYMSYGRNYLLGKMPSPNVAGPPPVLQLLNVDYGLSSISIVPWATSKFKATSYYSPRPLFLSATHIFVIPSEIIWWPSMDILGTLGWEGYPWNTWLRRISLEHLVENTKLTRRPKSWQ